MVEGKQRRNRTGDGAYMKTPIFTLIQAVPALGGQVPDTASFPSGGMPSDGTILAYHEAGHAFMAYFLGRGFTEVSIVPDEKNLVT